MPDPNDLLPPVPSDGLPPAPVSRKVICEFCECKLTAAGEVLQFSDKAKGFRNHTDAKDKLQARIGELETELAKVRAEKAALEASIKRPAGGGFDLSI